MPVGGHPPSNHPIGQVICANCRVGLHDQCRGAVTTCECWVEVLIEAEEAR